MPVFHTKQHELDAVWPHVAHYIKSALDTGHGEMTADQARYAIAKGMAELFILKTDDKINGAILVEFMNYPNYRVANVIALGGKGVVKDWAEFKQWLKFGGASYVEGHCFESVAKLWERKLGMKEAYKVMRAEL
jgi:hypothetical protein